MHRQECPGCKEEVVVNTSGDRADWFARARRSLQTAIDMEEYNPSAYMDMAKTYEDDGQPAEALAWVERAIAADGQENFQDFQAMFYLARLYGMMEQPSGVYDVARRVLAVLPGDPDARQYAAYEFASLAARLHEVRNYEAAGWFAYAAQLILPNDEKVRGLVQSSAMLQNAFAQINPAMTDPRLDDPIKRAAAFFLTVESGQQSDTAEAEFQNICQHIDSRPAFQTRASLEHLRTAYPALFECGQQFYTDLITALNKPQHRAAKTQQSAWNLNNGCLIWAAIAAAGIIIRAIAAAFGSHQ